MGHAVAELEERLRVEVGHRVTGLVVADVVGYAGGSAVHGGLLGRLDAFRAREQATGRDADRPSNAVGATAKPWLA
jgi:hypothetical protein